jgi:hypothetical protein
LPAAFATDTLTQIIFSSNSTSGNPNGAAFLAAITAQTPTAGTTPEPSGLALLGIGAGMAGFYRLRRRRLAATAAP